MLVFERQLVTLMCMRNTMQTFVCDTSEDIYDLFINEEPQKLS